MKFAPILAGGSLALVLYTLATAKAVSPPLHFEALDFRGIDTLEVHADNALNIEIDARHEPGLSYADSTESRVETRREGSRLVVNAKLSGYTSFDVVVPASVHRFITDGATSSRCNRCRRSKCSRGTGSTGRVMSAKLVLRDNDDHSATTTRRWTTAPAVAV
jgi:hypothetical protein